MPMPPHLKAGRDVLVIKDNTPGNVYDLAYGSNITIYIIIMCSYRRTQQEFGKAGNKEVFRY